MWRAAWIAVFMLIAGSAVRSEPPDSRPAHTIRFTISNHIGKEPEHTQDLRVGLEPTRAEFRLENGPAVSCYVEPTKNCRLTISMETSKAWRRREPSDWPIDAATGTKFEVEMQVGWHVWRVAGEVLGEG